MRVDVPEEIAEFIKVVTQLDFTSLIIMQNNADLLLARENLEKELEGKQKFDFLKQEEKK